MYTEANDLMKMSDDSERNSDPELCELKRYILERKTDE